MTARGVDDRIRRLARCQHGVFTRAQAEDLGATTGVISRRVKNRDWNRLAPSIYALAGTLPSWRQSLKAAELSVDGAAIAGKSAVTLHGLPGFGQGVPEITVASLASARNPLARVHRSDRTVTTTVDRIRVVTAEQAVFDIAGRVPHQRLEAVLDAGLVGGQIRLDLMRDRFHALRHGGPRGIAAVRALLAERADGYAPPESELERALRRALAGVPIPPVAWQVSMPWRPVGRHRVDGIIEDWRLILETDGRRWHTRLRDFERDLARDQQAVSHGYRVARFSWSHVSTAPAEVAATVVAAGRWRLSAA